MKSLLILIITLASLGGYSQKKLVLVTSSELTGVSLPQGSKSDKRFLMVTAAQILLEMVSKKYGTGIGATEVLTLPPVAACGYNSDTLVAQLTKLGWAINPVDMDDKYVWLQKEGRNVLAYLSTDKKETALYFGLATQQPAQTPIGLNRLPGLTRPVYLPVKGELPDPYLNMGLAPEVIF